MALKNIIPIVMFLVLVSTELKCPTQQRDATASLLGLLLETRSPQPKTVDMSPEAFEERLRASAAPTPLRPAPGVRFISQEEVDAERGIAPKPAPVAQTDRPAADQNPRQKMTSSRAYASDDLISRENLEKAIEGQKELQAQLYAKNLAKKLARQREAAVDQSQEPHPQHSSEAPETGPASRPSSASKRQRPISAAKR